MSFNIDPRGVLVDALKLSERFELSNTILPNKKSLKAVYELGAIRSDMLEFAKNPEVGISLLGAPPRKPNLDNYKTDDEKFQAEYEYEEMTKMYELQKQSLSMHVPFEDTLMINNYLKKFEDTLFATSAVKGKRFFAFTKNVAEPEQGMFDFLKRGGGNQ